MNLIKLAERVEAAAEGCRELDDAIATELFTGKHHVCIKGLSDEAGGMWMFHYPDGSIGSSLRFTASLDAAKTLVPKGMSFIIASEDDRGPPNAWVGHHDDPCPRCRGAATPALALTAAALRAKAGEG